jgi:hypothetical protein
MPELSREAIRQPAAMCGVEILDADLDLLESDLAETCESLLRLAAIETTELPVLPVADDRVAGRAEE